MKEIVEAFEIRYATVSQIKKQERKSMIARPDPNTPGALPVRLS